MTRHTLPCCSLSEPSSQFRPGRRSQDMLKPSSDKCSADEMTKIAGFLSINSIVVLSLIFMCLPIHTLPAPSPSAKSSAGSSLKYDQSQAGDYNVQVHLKNIEVYAILDDSSFGNEHYDYDYSELTLKPPTSPSEGSSVAAVTFTPSAKPTPNKEEDNTTALQEAVESTEVTTLSTSTLVTARTTRRCGTGYYRDHFGRCRRVRHPQLPLLSLSHLPRKTIGKTEEDGKTATTTPK